MRPSEQQSESAELADPDTVQLYFFPNTRAVRVRWMLEELGVPYDLHLVDLRRRVHRSDDYLAIHPLGKVPALGIDGTVLFESLAIVLYLADRYWEADLAPVPEARALRADYYKWMAYSTGTLEPALISESWLRKGMIPALSPIDLSPAVTPFEAAVGLVDRTLSTQPFLLGEQFSAADVMNGAVMMGAGDGDALANYRHIQRWVDALKSRPAFVRARAK